METLPPFPKPSILHWLVATAVIGLGIWGAGVMLSWIIGPQDVFRGAGGFGMLAPLLLIVQQYRATFRGHAVAAQYCWIFFAAVAAILSLIFLVEFLHPELRTWGTETAVIGLLLLASSLVAVVNHDWHRRLRNAAAQGLISPHRGRTSLREIMLWTVAAAAVFAIAGHLIRLGRPF